MDVIKTLEQIKKLTDLNSLNDQTDLIFKLVQIRGICDQAIAESNNNKVSLNELEKEYVKNDVKTFAEVCKR